MKKTGATVGLISAIATVSMSRNIAYADGPFNFSPFSSPAASHPSPPSNVPQPASSADSDGKGSSDKRKRIKNDQPRTTSAGFDPDALERGVEILKEIRESPNAKHVCICYLYVCGFN